MLASSKVYALSDRIRRRLGVTLTPDECATLRRCCLTLQRWHELECGDGNEWGSWAIERDDNGDGPPYMVRHHYGHGERPNTVTRTRIPDRERGALRRVSAIAQRYGLAVYQQTDPRGCALYLGPASMDNTNYSGVGVPLCD